MDQIRHDLAKLGADPTAELLNQFVDQLEYFKQLTQHHQTQIQRLEARVVELRQLNIDLQTRLTQANADLQSSQTQLQNTLTKFGLT